MKQTSKQASRQAGREAGRQASKQAEQARQLGVVVIMLVVVMSDVMNMHGYSLPVALRLPPYTHAYNNCSALLRSIVSAHM